MSRDVLGLVGLIALSLVVGGCEPYVHDFQFLPRPAVVELGGAATQPSGPLRRPLTVYAAIIGVRSADPKAGLPLSVEVRLRFDDAGPGTVEFDPNSLTLMTGELFRFSPPIVERPRTVSLQAGDSATIRAYFPFPPGTGYDRLPMGTLLLHWRVRIGDQDIPQSARFRRIDPDYFYDPRRYWGFPYTLGYPFTSPSAEIQFPQEP